jgi:hypothetical protein
VNGTDAVAHCPRLPARLSFWLRRDRNRAARPRDARQTCSAMPRPWNTVNPEGQRAADLYAAVRLRDVGGISRSAGMSNLSRSRLIIVMLSSRLPLRTSLTRLAVPRIGIRSARVSPC